MEFRVQIFGRVFCVCIGRETQWFSSCSRVAVIEEFYENRSVVYAKMLWRTGRKRCQHT